FPTRRSSDLSWLAAALELGYADIEQLGAANCRGALELRPARRLYYLQQGAGKRLTSTAAQGAAIGGELARRHITFVKGAQRGQVIERGRKRPREDHLERVEVANVIALVLEDGVELGRRG